MIPISHFKMSGVNIQQNINKDFLDNKKMAGFSFCLFSILSTRAIHYYYIQEQWHLFKNEHILCARSQGRDYCRELKAAKGL